MFGQLILCICVPSIWAQSNKHLQTTEVHNQLISAFTKVLPMEMVAQDDLSIRNVGSTYYQIIYEIGTPPQQFHSQVDTGSTILWVPSTECQACANRVKFHEADSSTYKKLNSRDSIQYGKGYCSGHFGEDILAIKGTPIKVKMSFLLVDKTRDFQTGSPGIMGLSNNHAFENVFDLAYKEKQIDSPLFGMWLSRNISQPSYILYGDIPENVLGSIPWVFVVSDKRWVQINKQIEGSFRDWLLTKRQGPYVETSHQCSIDRFWVIMFDNTQGDVRSLLGSTPQTCLHLHRFLYLPNHRCNEDALSQCHCLPRRSQARSSIFLLHAACASSNQTRLYSGMQCYMISYSFSINRISGSVSMGKRQQLFNRQEQLTEEPIWVTFGGLMISFGLISGGGLAYLGFQYFQMRGTL